MNFKDDLLLAKDKNDQTACRLVAWNEHPGVMTKLLKCAEAELSQQDLKNLLLAKDKKEKLSGTWQHGKTILMYYRT